MSDLVLEIDPMEPCAECGLGIDDHPTERCGQWQMFLVGGQWGLVLMPDSPDRGEDEPKP